MYQIQNPFSNEVWTDDGEIYNIFTKIHKDTLGGLNSYSEFKSKCSNSNGSENWHYKKWFKFINNIQSELDQNYSHSVDPIQYLKFLYEKEENWWEWLSIQGIYNRYPHSITAHLDRFRLFFKNTLEWNLRDASDRTDLWNKKLKASNHQDGIALKNEEKASNACRVFALNVMNIMQVKNNKLPEYTTLKNQQERNTYKVADILSINYNSVQEVLKKLNKVSWYWAISNWLNVIAEDKNLDYSFSRDHIRRIIK